MSEVPLYAGVENVAAAREQRGPSRARRRHRRLEPTFRLLKIMKSWEMRGLNRGDRRPDRNSRQLARKQ